LLSESAKKDNPQATDEGDDTSSKEDGDFEPREELLSEEFSDSENEGDKNKGGETEEPLPDSMLDTQT
jgi:hypothetical protein